MNSKLLMSAGVLIIVVASVMNYGASIRERRNDDCDTEIENCINILNRTLKTISDQSNASGAYAAVQDFMKLESAMQDAYIVSGCDSTRKDQAKQIAEVIHEFLRDLAGSCATQGEFDIYLHQESFILTAFVSRFTGISIAEQESELAKLMTQDVSLRVVRETEYRQKLSRRQPFVRLLERGAVKKEDRTLIYILGTLGGLSLLAGIGTMQLGGAVRAIDTDIPKSK